MTQLAWALLALATAFAVADWIGVLHSDRRLILVGKPAALLLLVAVALALQPASERQRDLFMVALLLCLCGDVLLMLDDRWFKAGLAAFLLGHLAYIAGFLVAGVEPRWVLLALAPVLLAAGLVGGQVILALRKGGRPGLVAPVALYLVALSAVVLLAAGSGRPAAMTGATLFYLSDGLLAWNRFVRRLAWAPVAIMVTYHLAQAGLVLSLAG